VYELVVKGHLTTSPEVSDSLTRYQPEEVIPLGRVLERDNTHAILPAVVPGLEPAEMSVPLPPSQQVSPPLKVVITTPRGGDGLNSELAKCLGG